MIRRIEERDRELYYKYVDRFYHSDVVNAPVPEINYELTFNEFMRSDDYVWCYIFECDNKPCGFAMLSKTFSAKKYSYNYYILSIFESWFQHIEYISPSLLPIYLYSA